ncbi:MAG TPA: response regulator [Balneolales bacterium]|nr:response regulator [Balneolales bacterium]
MKNGKKVLIIENDELITIVLRTFLEKMGYSVIESTTTGEDAIQIALSNYPDIILSDIVLNGTLTGIETVKEIQKAVNADVIYMTNYTDPKYRRDAAETNYLDYLLKPITFHTLKRVLDNR